MLTPAQCVEFDGLFLWVQQSRQTGYGIPFHFDGLSLLLIVVSLAAGYSFGRRTGRREAHGAIANHPGLIAQAREHRE